MDNLLVVLTQGWRRDYVEKSLVFEQWWPDAERHVRKVLRKAGDSPHDVDERVQLTAERLLKTHKTFESADHLAAWCTTTAKRIRTDEWRKSRLLPESYAASDPITYDAADAAEWGIRLDAVLEAIPSLPDAERTALFASETGGDRKAVVRLAVARHRAREKLRRIADGAIAAFAGRAHRFVERLRSFGTSETQAAVAAIATAVLGIGALAHLEQRPTATPPVADLARSQRIDEVRSEVQPGPTESRAVAPVLLTPVKYVNPSPVPRVNIADRVEIGPSEERDPPFYCGLETPITPYRCFDPPIPSIDDLLGTDLL